MADDVVDIRKRIEEIRNEVSTAMASKPGNSHRRQTCWRNCRILGAGRDCAKWWPTSKKRPAATGDG